MKQKQRSPSNLLPSIQAVIFALAVVIEILCQDICRDALLNEDDASESDAFSLPLIHQVLSKCFELL